MIEELEQTCAELEEEAKYYSDPISCRYYHRYGNECGCGTPNRPPAETFCDLCQDATPIPDSDRQLEGYGGTCGTLQLDAAWNLWHTLDENWPMDETTGIQGAQANCNYYHHAGHLCGCRNNRPPATGCKLCKDGEAPRNGRKTVTPGDAAEENCQAYSLFSHYVQTSGSRDCNMAQAVVGPYCGCAGTSDEIDFISAASYGESDSELTPVCNFCPTGMVVKDSLAPSLNLEENGRVFHFRDAACIKVAMLATEFNFTSSDVPVDFVDVCCEPIQGTHTPQLNTQDVFIQDEPSLINGAGNKDFNDDTPELDWSSVVILTKDGSITSKARGEVNSLAFWGAASLVAWLL